MGTKPAGKRRGEETGTGGKGVERSEWCKGRKSTSKTSWLSKKPHLLVEHGSTSTWDLRQSAPFLLQTNWPKYKETNKKEFVNIPTQALHSHFDLLIKTRTFQLIFEFFFHLVLLGGHGFFKSVDFSFRLCLEFHVSLSSKKKLK